MNYFLSLLFAFQFFCAAQAQQLEVVTDHWPPFIVDSQPVSGTVTRKVRKILDYAGLDYQIKLYPWARSYYLGMTKPNVLIYSIFRTKSREPHFHWFCPVNEGVTINLYKLKGNTRNIDSLAAVRNVLIGVMRDDHNHSYLVQQGFIEGVNLDISADEQINLRKLFNGRVDAVGLAQESLEHRLAMLGYSKDQVVKGMTLHIPAVTKHCMALSVGSDQVIIEKISAGFRRWLDEQK
ncbi:transporter substrate-binding domain-containing protein [Thalassomonas sp. RHCl1]|uniref:transporter substrate-binding domain-containing protein n=1 Tax=Thalassomonas sp. RHCl1 TaxID=2995320 RepID=UPI00248D06CA|nr:transporter substrate-binding domain-containing protein [Thalassomonas sp. RHCl1]